MYLFAAIRGVQIGVQEVGQPDDGEDRVRCGRVPGGDQFRHAVDLAGLDCLEDLPVGVFGDGCDGCAAVRWDEDQVGVPGRHLFQVDVVPVAGQFCTDGDAARDLDQAGLDHLAAGDTQGAGAGEEDSDLVVLGEGIGLFKNGRLDPVIILPPRLQPALPCWGRKAGR